MSYAFMKLLESAPERYDAGISILTLGRLRHLEQDIVDEFIARDDRVLELGCGTCFKQCPKQAISIGVPIENFYQ